MEWLEQCLSNTHYIIERKGEGGILIIGTRLGYFNRIVNSIINTWEPYLILSENLGDCWYEGNKNIFHRGGKFKTLGKCDQQAMEYSPFMEYMTSKSILVFGIIGKDFSRNSDALKQIEKFSFLPRLLVEVAYDNAHPKLPLCKTLEQENIPFTTVYWPGIEQFIHTSKKTI